METRTHDNVKCPFLRHVSLASPDLMTYNRHGGLWAFVRTVNPYLPSLSGKINALVMCLVVTFGQYGWKGLACMYAPDIARLDDAPPVSHPDLFQTNLLYVEEYMRSAADLNGTVSKATIKALKQTIADRLNVSPNVASRAETDLLCHMARARNGRVDVDRVLSFLDPHNTTHPFLPHVQPYVHVPLCQYPAHWILSITARAIASAGAYAAVVDYHSIHKVLDVQYRDPSPWDRMARWLLGEPTMLPASVCNPNEEIRAHLVPAILLSRLNRAYCWRLDATRWPDGRPEIRRAQLNALVRESPVLPPFRTPLELLEYALRNVDLLDLLHPMENDATCLVLCTLHIDRVSLQGHPHGATLLLNAKTMHIEQLDHRGRTYGRDMIPPVVASRALWGILSYITAVTHLYHLHIQCSALLARVSERLLDRTHPLRLVLLPSELGTTDVLARAVPALLTARGMPAQCFPWTFDGLQELLRDYVPWSPRRAELLFMDEYREVPVIGDFGRWWAYIYGHMHRVVHALYETDDMLSRDTQATQWLREASPLLGVDVTAPARERVSTVLTRAFFTQIRHNFLSNAVFSHMSRWYYVLHPGPVSVGQAIRSTMIASTTSLQWVPMLGRKFEAMHLHAPVRRIMEEFYAGLGPTDAFAQSILHPLALPSEMECSTGV